MIYLLQLHREDPQQYNSFFSFHIPNQVHVLSRRYCMFSQHDRTWRAWIRLGMYLHV